MQIRMIRKKKSQANHHERPEPHSLIVVACTAPAKSKYAQLPVPYNLNADVSAAQWHHSIPVRRSSA